MRSPRVRSYSRHPCYHDQTVELEGPIQHCCCFQHRPPPAPRAARLSTCGAPRSTPDSSARGPCAPALVVDGASWEPPDWILLPGCEFRAAPAVRQYRPSGGKRRGILHCRENLHDAALTGVLLSSFPLRKPIRRFGKSQRMKMSSPRILPSLLLPPSK